MSFLAGHSTYCVCSQYCLLSGVTKQFLKDYKNYYHDDALPNGSTAIRNPTISQNLHNKIICTESQVNSIADTMVVSDKSWR